MEERGGQVIILFLYVYTRACILADACVREILKISREHALVYDVKEKYHFRFYRVRSLAM